jgi:hypothetical protein
MLSPPPNRIIRRHALALAHLITDSIAGLAVQMNEQQRHDRSI